MWDGRAASLEEQALGPIQSASEMNMPIDGLMIRLASIAEYRSLSTSTFPRRGITPATLAEALATYERTIVSERSPFDAWIEGDEHAISEQAKRGFAIFNAKGRCSACHEGWNFTNDGFYDIGLPPPASPSGAVFFGHAVDDDAAPDVHHRQAHGGLAEIGKADPQRRQIDRLGQALQFDSQRSRIGAGSDAAGGVHAADDDHRTGELRLGHRLQHLHAVAVLEHQVEGHAVEPGRLDLFDRLRA